MRELDALIRRRNVLTRDRLELACLTGGIAASASYNAAGATKRGGGSFSPADFLPRAEERVSPEQMLAMCEVMTAGFGGQRVVHDG
jgi:hypothetical protein